MKNGMVFSSRERDRPLLGAGLIGCSVCNQVLQQSHLKISSRRNTGVDILQ